MNIYSLFVRHHQSSFEQSLLPLFVLFLVFVFDCYFCLCIVDRLSFCLFFRFQSRLGAKPMYWEWKKVFGFTFCALGPKRKVGWKKLVFVRLTVDFLCKFVEDIYVKAKFTSTDLPKENLKEKIEKNRPSNCSLIIKFAFKFFGTTSTNLKEFW